MLLLLATAAPHASAGTLEQIRETGKLRLGFADAARPFSYVDDSGVPAGYAVALCEQIAGTLKADLKLPELKTEFIKVGAQERFDAVKAGRIDLLCTGGAQTLSRREDVAFSIPVFLGGVGALVRSDAPKSLREVLEGRPEPYEPRWRASLSQVLRGRVFAVPKGTPAENLLRERIKEFTIPAEVAPVDTLATGVARVADGSADGLFGDRELLLAAAKQSPDADKLVVLERRFSYEAYALALPRGDEDFRLTVDRALSRLYRSDQISAVYTPYFGKPEELALRFFRMSSLPD